jgi:hypothetical protein
MVWGGAGLAAVQVAVPPVAEGVTAETFAPAPPLFVSVRFTVTAWPMLAVDRVAEKVVAASAAGVWTVTAAAAAGVALTGCPELTSVPLAVPDSERLPAEVGVQVHVKARFAPPAIGWGSTGETAPQVAAAVPVTEVVREVMFATPAPPFVTVKVTVTA